MDSRGVIPPILRIAARPKHTISDRNGEKIELQTPAPSILLYVQDCKNCELELEKKALKVIVDGCKDCLLNINNSLITGMIEVLNCENLAVNILNNGVIMTLTIDGSKNIKVNALKNDQFESIYTHHSHGVEVVVGTVNPTRIPVVTDDEPERQYLVHWEKDGGTLKLICDKVIRDGKYPTTEKKLAEARAREREMSQKMATMLVDSIKVTKKSKKAKSKKDGRSADTPTVSPPPKQQPEPPNPPPPRSAPNIENDDEKREFFERRANGNSLVVNFQLFGPLHGMEIRWQSTSNLMDTSMVWKFVEEANYGNFVGSHGKSPLFGGRFFQCYGIKHCDCFVFSPYFQIKVETKKSEP